MEITKRVVEFVSRTRYDTLPIDVVNAAKTAIIDCLGVTLAGSKEESAIICAEIVRQEGATAEATIFGQGFKSSAAQAAFANGTAAHALDFDHSTYLGQPTSALIPALISLGESLGVSGPELLQAYVAGFEVTTKIAKSITEKGRGDWHSAGTLGTLGAALSCAKLLGLDVDKTRMALGIATSMASGIAGNYGTMTKPLDTGLAARNGIVAAKLAQRGYTANPQALEGEAGFFKTFFSSPPDPAPLAELGRSYELVTGIKIKNYPCGGLTHPAIDAVLELRSAHGIRPGTIESIQVEVPKHTFKRIVFKIPQSGLEGKFCMGYIVARAMIDGKVSLDAFTDSAVRDSQVLQLAGRVDMTLDNELRDDAGYRPCKVSIRLKDGQSFAKTVEHARGSREVPLSPQELRNKFSECARRRINDQTIDAALKQLERLETLQDIRPLCKFLAG
jgi:2-methylcitrate dehydratase PrpD